MRFFKKENIRNPVKFNGTPVQWEMVGQNTGVTRLDPEQHAGLIAFLDGLADNRKMGVVRISAEIYEDLKKNGVRAYNPPQLNQEIKPLEKRGLFDGPSERSGPAVSPARPLGVKLPEPSASSPRTIHASPALQAMLQEQGQSAPPPITLPPNGAKPEAKPEAKAPAPAKPRTDTKAKAKKAQADKQTPPATS